MNHDEDNKVCPENNRNLPFNYPSVFPCTCKETEKPAPAQVEKCRCACHDNVLKTSYEHDAKCCDSMNGSIPAPTAVEQIPQCTRGHAYPYGGKICVCGAKVLAPKAVEHGAGCAADLDGCYDGCEDTSPTAVEEAWRRDFRIMLNQLNDTPYTNDISAPIKGDIYFDGIEVEKFIRTLLASEIKARDRQHEILVNTILATKNKEIEEAYERGKAEEWERVGKMLTLKYGGTMSKKDEMWIPTLDEVRAEARQATIELFVEEIGRMKGNYSHVKYTESYYDSALTDLLTFADSLKDK